MKILDTLVGRKVKVKTDMQVSVELTIKSIEENHNSQDIGPSTRENDWWPEQRTWTTFDVKFTNGSHKSFSSLSDIDIVE